MPKVTDIFRQFLAYPEDDADEDFSLPLDESRKLIRPMGTVRAVEHSFRTHRSGKNDTVQHASGVQPLDDESRALLELAKAVKDKAYAQYSGFHVGAALLAESGQVYLGVNVENSSYPAGICAERSAVSAAVTAGERKFSAIAISGGKGDTPCYPCGICRQVLSEFCGKDFAVILSDGVYSLESLLPYAFSLDT